MVQEMSGAPVFVFTMVLICVHHGEQHGEHKITFSPDFSQVFRILGEKVAILGKSVHLFTIVHQPLIEVWRSLFYNSIESRTRGEQVNKNQKKS